MTIPPRPASSRLLVSLLLGFLWFSSAFFGGYLLGQADAVNGNLRVAEAAMRLASVVGLHPPLLGAGSSLDVQDQGRFRVFWEAWGLIGREFYNRSAVDGQKMTYGAIQGMVQSLGDPNTAFSTPREKELSDSSLRGSFDGIGIQIDQRDGQIQVIAPLDGSPAARAGLRPGDIISRVNDQNLKGQALNDVVGLIRGPRGTTVVLTISRPGQADPLVLTIERAEIRTEAVRSSMLDGQIGYLRITSFSATAGTDTATALKRLNDQQPRGLVLDLRSNPGGYLTAAVDVASQFLKDGVVLYQENSQGERQEYRVKPGGQATDLPLTVLINHGSASASEIVAAALRDNGRAQLIGEKSYGKGSVQSVHTLSDSSGLRVTSAIWLTPNGQPLDKVGLEPDLAVAAPAAPSAGQDPQLDAALRQVQQAAAQPVPAGA